MKGSDVQKKYYKKYANKLTHIKELSKQLYFKNKLTTLKNDMKGTWKLIRQIIKLKSKGTTSPNKIINGGQEYKTPWDIAEEFNNFFQNIGPNLANQITSSTNSFSEFLSPQLHPDSFFYISNHSK